MDREYLISQYVDGTISDADRAVVEALLADDESARRMLADERKFTNFLIAASAPMEAVDWEALAACISDRVGEASEPAQSYRLAPRWLPARMAMAASLLIATGIGISVYLSSAHRTPASIPQVAVAKPVLIVTGPVAEAAPNGIADVSVGPGPQELGVAAVSRYSSDLVTRQARVVIASGINPPTSTDASSLPY